MRENKTLRGCPWYKEFASDMLADERYITLNANARGVLYSIRLRCWVNGSVPADPKNLAAMLGLDPDVVACVVPQLLKVNLVQNCSDDGDRLLVQELAEMQKAFMETSKKRQESGQKGGASTVRTYASRREQHKPVAQANAQANAEQVLKPTDMNCTDLTCSDLTCSELKCEKQSIEGVTEKMPKGLFTHAPDSAPDPDMARNDEWIDQFDKSPNPLDRSLGPVPQRRTAPRPV